MDAGSTDFRAAVLEETGGRGADLVAEVVGSRETFPLSLEAAVAEANILWFGLPEQTADYPISFNDFFRRKLTAYSTYGAQGEPGLESFRYAVRLIADAAIDVSPLLSHMLPIEEVGEAFRIARERTVSRLSRSPSSSDRAPARPPLAMQVQQRQHLGDLRGLRRPRWQDRRGEPSLVAGVRVGALVVDPGTVTSTAPALVSTSRGW